MHLKHTSCHLEIGRWVSENVTKRVERYYLWIKEQWGYKKNRVAILILIFNNVHAITTK